MKNKYVWQRRKEKGERERENAESAPAILKQLTHTQSHTLQHTWNWKRKYFSVTFVFFQHKRGNEIVWQVKTVERGSEGELAEGGNPSRAVLLIRQLPPCTAQTVLEATQTYVAPDSTQNVRGLSFVSDSAPHSPSRHKLSCPEQPQLLPKGASFSENQLNFLHSKL